VTLPAAWPPFLPTGFTLWSQFWWKDAGGAQGWAASNGLRGVQH
jgi:hypothetical protein